MDVGDETLLEALEAGAAGYLLKSRGISPVVDLVRRAAAREALFPADTMSRVMAAMREKRRREAEQSSLVERLTAREMEILELMAQGLDTKALAERLVVSSTTVRTHVQSILAKLEAHSRLEAVARAKELGILRH
jgi:DNA-binding NarL/FixJ family response regulator